MCLLWEERGFHYNYLLFIIKMLPDALHYH